MEAPKAPPFGAPPPPVPLQVRTAGGYKDAAKLHGDIIKLSQRDPSLIMEHYDDRYPDNEGRDEKEIIQKRLIKSALINLVQKNPELMNVKFNNLSKKK